MPRPTPVTVSSRITTNLASENGIPIAGGYNGYGYIAPIGYNHMGVNDLDRITMSFKSGIASEVKWALTNMARISTQNGFQLERKAFIGIELVKHVIRVYQLIAEKKEDDVTTDDVNFSLDALLTLRNLGQEPDNQHWLLQFNSFKKNLLDMLKLLYGWFYTDTFKPSFHLKQFENQFREAFGYVLDLLEPLTCYYIDNGKNDPLFNVLLNISVLTTDKAVFISALTSLSHMLIVSEPELDVNEEGQKDKSELEEESTSKMPTNNCIDAIKDKHLECYVNQLLVNDNDLNGTVLEFLKMYLFSTALHSEVDTVEASQVLRLNKLLQLDSSRTNLSTLMKQLPVIILSNVAGLSDPDMLLKIPEPNLTRRSNYSGVPTELPELPEDLYEIITRFPEPLRATTWLRCCYEPYNHTGPATVSADDEVLPGEVTQISLWKAYEKQFQKVWESADKSSKPLLPAVDFIKNVSNAFPNSEAMVINLNVLEGEKPKKKFIIKGIQPRQFAASIDVGNYDALKVPSAHENDTEEVSPIGHVNEEEFYAAIFSTNEKILSQRIQREHVNKLSVLSAEILDYIVREMLDVRQNSQVSKHFKLFNGYWLPGIIFANPSLLDTGLVNSDWLRYLL